MAVVLGVGGIEGNRARETFHADVAADGGRAGYCYSDDQRIIGTRFEGKEWEVVEKMKTALADL